MELSRELGDKVFKNDRIRAAVHMLVEGYARNGQNSSIARKTRTRSPR